MGETIKRWAKEVNRSTHYCNGCTARHKGISLLLVCGVHVAYSSVHGPRWCADSWDSVEQSEAPLMQSLAKVMEPSGWMMWPVLDQSLPWTDVLSEDGASTTAIIVKMQE